MQLKKYTKLHKIIIFFILIIKLAILNLIHNIP